MIVDYFSKYPEIVKLHRKTSDSVISAMKEIFARHGIPQKMVTDNMPFNSLKFKEFCQEWEITLVTSSPMYPRSNGLAERNVQSIKNLIKKAEESNHDLYLSLLELRNTPIADLSYSPAELLMSRKLRARLPISKTLLKPSIAENAYEKLKSRQIAQKRFHDRRAKSMKPLHENDVVRIQRDGQWKPAVVTHKHSTPRSYYVTTPDGSTYRRNRFHLMKTREQMPQYIGPSIDEEFERSTNSTQEERPLRRTGRRRQRTSRLIETC